MAAPVTLRKAQKDSPSTFLMTAINTTTTSITVANSDIFNISPPITRLTLGYDQDVTETVTVVSYGASGQITVVRGSPGMSWPQGTKVARVLTAEDINEIQQYLDYVDGMPIDGTLIVDNSIPILKNILRTKKVFYSIYSYIDPSNPNSVYYSPWNTSASFGIMLEGNKAHGSIGSSGIIPSDYVNGGIVYPVLQTFLGMDTGHPAYFEYEVNVGQFIGGGRIDSRTQNLEYRFEGPVNIPPTTVNSGYMFVDMPGITLPTVYADDIITIDFLRDPLNSLDTYTLSLSLRGFILSYSGR